MLLLCAGTDEEHKNSFSINIEEASKLRVFTRMQALDYIGARVRRKWAGPSAGSAGPRRPNWEEAMEALSTIVIAHIPVTNFNLRPKAIYVAIMARRVLIAMKDENMVDDRDYVGNKRLELCVRPLLDILWDEHAHQF